MSHVVALAMGVEGRCSEGAGSLVDLLEQVRADRTAHDVVGRLCDDFGGRLSGSEAHRLAMQQLVRELRAIGIEAEMQGFEMPGWVRGHDEVRVVAPFERALRVAAFGYSQPKVLRATDLVDIGQGRAVDYVDRNVRRGIGLLAPYSTVSLGEVAMTAARNGLVALLVINREGGGQLLARTGGFDGKPLPLPVLSVTQEEGRWMQRLLQRGSKVRVEAVVRSYCKRVKTANLVVRLPGTLSERVLVGAHFDSWDLGQGAMDNGLGIAQLFAVARGLRDRPRHRTIELVWFSGEEQGLWGSRRYADQTRSQPVAVMINLDMVGLPLAVNALGDDALAPVLERWRTAVGEANLPEGVISRNWLASDHTPFQIAGVRAVTFNAPLPREVSRYYHDLADTWDKIDPDLVANSSAVIATLVQALADDESIEAVRRDESSTRALFSRFGLSTRLEASGLWPALHRSDGATDEP